ncbi:MAG: hypothetical protein O2954_20915, partial [bacterium]|nr:hypothetical protein [bacterium]
KDAAQLIEEMLAILLQNILDGGAGSNLPNESQGTLVLLRCLDRPDAQSVMDWLYDEGPDTLRVFTTNDFSPDGTPPESTGGYNSIHTYGFFGLEQHLRGLRQQQPSAYPESRYPSLVTDPRTPHIVRHPYEITMIGKTYFQFGDGSAPGTSSQLGGRDDQKENSIRLQQDYFQAPLGDRVLDLAAELTGDPVVQEIRDTVEHRQHRNHGPTIHDNMGVAILRTSETPERAAAGIAYGDTHGHRHRDLLDVQLFAFERPFLTDLGYPQSWASRPAWEDHWATHNTVWGALPDGPIENIAGRGKLLRTLFIDGLQILDIEAYRWIWDETQKCWVRPGVTYHRLLALVETDGEGVALVDLSRITGGIEHWRTCRGLEGEFHSDNTGLQPRNGTVANPGAKRGDTSQLTHPDHKALAYMDDVASGQAPASWNGAWQSRFESAVHLDLHQLHVSPSTELLTARATAMMGNPDASTYNFRSVLWHRKPQNDTTCIDLVFEPRIDAPTLATAETISSDSKTATGVRLTTRQGKQIELYWAPGTKPENITQFENGARLQGPLAAIVNGKIATTGTTEFQTSKKSYTFPNAIQTATITALDRTARTIDAQGLTSISSGDRIVINPNGRAHSYLVETVETLDNNRHRLTLNVVSILARGKILVRDKNRIEIGMQGNPSNLIRLHAQARTGNLHSTRFEPETGEPWAEIQTASNPGNDRTVIHLHPDHVERLGNLDIGTWMRIVDYEIGDTVRFEPTYTA